MANPQGAVAAAPARTEAGAAPPAFASIPLAHLVESPHNPRRQVEAGALQELAASIRQQGIVEPLVVRPLTVLQAVGTPPEAAAGGGARFEIVAGCRRFRAASLAGLTAVPCVVRPYSDEDVLELVLVENLQRADLRPLEQARGFRALITANATKYTAATIGQRLGMSERWVWDRLSLTQLIPEAQALIEEERMTAGHAVPIARLTPAQQQRVIHPHDGGLFEDEAARLPLEGAARATRTRGRFDGLKARSVRELADWIARHIRFDPAHMGTAAPLDFGETAQKVTEAQAQPGRGRRVVPITFEWTAPADTRDERERTYGSSAWKRADGQEKTTSCEHAVLGVVVAGPQRYGEAFPVCIARDRCQVHWKTEIAAREKTAKLRTSGKTTQADRREATAAAQQRRKEHERAAREVRWTVFQPALTKAVHAAAAKMPQTLPTRLFAQVLKSHRLPPATSVAGLAKALLLDAIGTAFDRHTWYQDEPGLVAWATLLGVDVQACEPTIATSPTAGDKKTTGTKTTGRKRPAA